MSPPKVKATSARQRGWQYAKRCVVAAGLFVLALFAGTATWDRIETMHFDAASSPDGGAGYDDLFPSWPNKLSPGYSTGPEDKAYLKLPGVPNSPRLAP